MSASAEPGEWRREVWGPGGGGGGNDCRCAAAAAAATPGMVAAKRGDEENNECKLGDPDELDMVTWSGGLGVVKVPLDGVHNDCKWSATVKEKKVVWILQQLVEHLRQLYDLEHPSRSSSQHYYAAATTRMFKVVELPQMLY